MRLSLEYNNIDTSRNSRVSLSAGLGTTTMSGKQAKKTKHNEKLLGRMVNKKGKGKSTPEMGAAMDLVNLKFIHILALGILCFAEERMAIVGYLVGLVCTGVLAFMKETILTPSLVINIVSKASHVILLLCGLHAGTRILLTGEGDLSGSTIGTSSLTLAALSGTLSMHTFMRRDRVPTQRGWWARGTWRDEPVKELRFWVMESILPLLRSYGYDGPLYFVQGGQALLIIAKLTFAHGTIDGLLWQLWFDKVIYYHSLLVVTVTIGDIIARGKLGHSVRKLLVMAIFMVVAFFHWLSALFGQRDGVCSMALFITLPLMACLTDVLHVILVSKKQKTKQQMVQGPLETALATIAPYQNLIPQLIMGYLTGFDMFTVGCYSSFITPKLLPPSVAPASGAGVMSYLFSMM